VAVERPWEDVDFTLDELLKDFDDDGLKIAVLGLDDPEGTLADESFEVELAIDMESEFPKLVDLLDEAIDSWLDKEFIEVVPLATTEDVILVLVEADDPVVAGVDVC